MGFTLPDALRGSPLPHCCWKFFLWGMGESNEWDLKYSEGAGNACTATSINGFQHYSFDGLASGKVIARSLSTVHLLGHGTPASQMEGIAPLERLECAQQRLATVWQNHKGICFTTQPFFITRVICCPKLLHTVGAATTHDDQFLENISLADLVNPKQETSNLWFGKCKLISHSPTITCFGCRMQCIRCE